MRYRSPLPNFVESAMDEVHDDVGGVVVASSSVSYDRCAV